MTILVPLVLAAAAVKTPLASLDLAQMTSGWGKPMADRSVRGEPLRIAQRTYSHGVGTHADSLLRVRLPGGPARFVAEVGVDDAAGEGRGSVEFRVLADGRRIWQSGPMRGGSPARRIEVDLTDVREVVLRVTDAGDGTVDDLADWADAVFITQGGRPEAVSPVPEELPEIRTPPVADAPCFNHPRVVGARPGRPFLLTLPVSGRRPMRFSCTGLPAGLQLDEAEGRIIGTTPPEPGVYDITVRASNSHGGVEGQLRLICGEALAPTPPMGWNSWNCYGADVSQERVEAIADAIAAEGLHRHGWMYVCVDDAWQNRPDSDDPALRGPARDTEGRILPNRRFPDMAGLVRRIHSLGLRAGIYSSPGPVTCAGHTGSYGHEAADADLFARWGFDILKYDWCAYSRVARGSTLFEQMKPYLRMAAELRRQPRDIILSICQYGVGNVSGWGRAAGGQLWRTTGDIEDTWASVSRIGFGQAGLELFAGPGGWNDPDMLVVGWVGWGTAQRPTRLTPNEQYSHISLWCLLAAPLFLGCDLTRLDDFTRNLITNDEVIGINQDPLGRQASRVAVRETVQVWAKRMADGSLAVGLFNLDEEPVEADLRWSDLGMTGRWRARDPWRRRDLGVISGRWSVTLPRHGCELIRLWPDPSDPTARCDDPPHSWRADPHPIPIR